MSELSYFLKCVNRVLKLLDLETPEKGGCLNCPYSVTCEIHDFNKCGIDKEQLNK